MSPYLRFRSVKFVEREETDLEGLAEKLIFLGFCTRCLAVLKAGQFEVTSGWVTLRCTGRRVNLVCFRWVRNPAARHAKQRAEEARLDGCYVIKTDRSKELSTEEVHARYKDLTDVEFAFRTMKTTFLEMRGIFVRKENRTRSHVFIVMLSYMLAYCLRRLWKDVDLTVEEGLEELGSINAMEVHYPQLSYQKIPEPRPIGVLLLQKAGISLPDAIPCKGVSVLTRKTLVSERKNLRPRTL